MQRLMRKAALLMWWLCLCSTLSAQYYLRGEVKDEKNSPLQNVKIILHSTDLPYASGVGGAFGIITSLETDSLTFSTRRLSGSFIVGKDHQISHGGHENASLYGQSAKKSSPFFYQGSSIVGSAKAG